METNSLTTTKQNKNKTRTKTKQNNQRGETAKLRALPAHAELIIQKLLQNQNRSFCYSMTWKRKKKTKQKKTKLLCPIYALMVGKCQHLS